MSPRTASASSPQSAPADQPAHRLWRRLAIIAGIALGIVGLGAALLLIAPRHVARYVANHYVQGMQIDVEGVKTIDVALLKGEVSMGPVRFHAGTADPGSIGQLGVKLSLRNLLEKQALLESVVVDGAGLQNIEQYTGPFDFKRRDGTLTVYARNDLELFPDGRLNGTTDATLVLGNVDVADPSRGEVKLDQCGITADARYGIDEAGVTTVDGKAEAKLNQADARLPNGIGA